jgi:hypothetical protein
VVKRTAPGDGPGRNQSGARRAPSAAGDHWKRLLWRAPRAPERLDAVAFVAELNRRLLADPCRHEGTRFIVAADPDGGVAGSTWEGPESMKPVIARIVKSTLGEFAVEQPFLFDR